MGAVVSSRRIGKGSRKPSVRSAARSEEEGRSNNYLHHLHYLVDLIGTSEVADIQLQSSCHGSMVYLSEPTRAAKIADILEKKNLGFSLEACLSIKNNTRFETTLHLCTISL